MPVMLPDEIERAIHAGRYQAAPRPGIVHESTGDPGAGSGDCRYFAGANSSMNWGGDGSASITMKRMRWPTRLRPSDGARDAGRRRFLTHHGPAPDRPSGAAVACRPGGSAVWRDGRLLVVRKGEVFPNRCVKSDRPAHGRRVQQVARRGCAVSFLVHLCNPIAGVLVADSVTKGVAFSVGLSDEWCRKRRRAFCLAGGIIIVSLPGMAYGVTLIGVADIGLWLLLLGILSTLGGSSTGSMPQRWLRRNASRKIISGLRGYIQISWPTSPTGRANLPTQGLLEKATGWEVTRPMDQNPYQSPDENAHPTRRLP